MQIAKKGDIKLFCQPNALVTLNEYLIDYANENVREKGKQLIQNELNTMLTDKEITEKLLNRINTGERNICK